MTTEPTPAPESPEPAEGPQEQAAPEQAAAPAPDAATARPPEPAETPPVTGTRTGPPRRFDFVLIGLLLVLAFLLGSFAIQKSDFWLHLATGRYLAGDLTRLGVDPFLFTSEGVQWINHSWLFDLFVYGIHETAFLGGPALVLFNALIVAAMTVIMLRTRPVQGNLWIGVICIGLALLAMSIRLFFDPEIFSLLFLAITGYLLLKPVADNTESSKFLWLLPPLFVLWVNLDAWFILGPVLVALVLMGEGIQALAAPDEQRPLPPERKARLRTLGLVLLVGVAVCLVNPFLHRAFTLPPELAYLLLGLGDFWPAHFVQAGTVLAETIGHDPTFTQHLLFWQSPLFDPYWQQPLRGLNLVALGYYLLLLAGMASFLAPLLLNKDPQYRSNLWPRFLVWLVFAVLSLSMGRMILFFAVVAGPITAYNWQEFLHRITAGPGTRRAPASLSVVGRFLTAVVLVVLVVAAWPGWLQNRFDRGNSPFRVHFAIAPDPALVQSARDLAELEPKGGLRVFNYSPALASYCAWFSPEVKSFYDIRFGLLRGKEEALARIRQGFHVQAEFGLLRKRGKADEKSFQVFLKAVGAQDHFVQQHQVTHFVLTNVANQRDALLLVESLLIEPGNWRLVAANGFLAAFQRTDEKVYEVGETEVGIDFAALAFTGKREEIAAEQIVFPRPPTRMSKFLFGEKKASLATQRANFYLLCHDILRKKRASLHFRLFEYPVLSLPTMLQFGGNMTALAPAAGALTSPITLMQSRLALKPELANFFYRPADAGPPGLALLAVQAARQGVQENPDDPEAYRWLAKAYDVLAHQEEDYWNPPRDDVSTMRQELRFKQEATAWHHLQMLDPGDFEANYFLVQLCLELNYIDLALDHAHRARASMAKIPLRPGDQELLNLKKQVEEWVDVLTKEFPARKQYFDSRTRGLKSVEKAMIALFPPGQLPPELVKKIEPGKIPRGLGLAKIALALLEEQTWEALSVQEKRDTLGLKLRILTSLGRMEEVLDILQTHDEQDLGPYGPAAWLQVAVTMGAYDLAEQKLIEIEEKTALDLSRAEPIPLELLDPKLGLKNPAGVVSFLGLPGEAALFSSPLQVVPTLGMRQLFQWHLQGRPDYGLNVLADYRFVRGLIALEAGDPDKAATLFQSALSLESPVFRFIDWPIAENFLRQIQHTQQRPK